MSKVFIVGQNRAYVVMFLKAGWEVCANLEDADLVQFTGGEDVTPAYYGEKKHPATSNSVQRDEIEVSIFDRCVGLGKPMVGICRGGQFLHVMCGGDLWQDVRGHAIYGTHLAKDVDTGISLQVTSTHHQMMRHNAGVLVLRGTHHPCIGKEHMVGDTVTTVDSDIDVEAVYHEDSKVFCFQPHPEFDSMDDSMCRKYYFGKIKHYFDLGE